MLIEHPIRLPLATGASPADLALGIGILGFLGSAPIFIGSVLPLWVAVVCGVLIALWFGALVTVPSAARRQRASDVILDGSGLSIDGGMHDARVLAWSELVTTPPKLVHPAPRAQTRLLLARDIEVVSDQADESVSLANLATTLCTLAQGWKLGRAPARPLGTGSAVPGCAECGAPLVPSESEYVKCRHCGAQTEMPANLRREVQQVRELAQARAQTGSSLRALANWPTARSVNLGFAAAVVPLVLGWPAASVFVSEFFQSRDVFSWRDVGVVFVSTAAATLGLCFRVVGQVVHRRAFGLVVATFHAVRTSEDGVCCRNCGAPLAVGPDTALVSCVFCREDNVVLGIDLPPQVVKEASQAESLDRMVANRMQSMRFWRRLSWLSLTLIVTGAALLYEPLSRAVRSQTPAHESLDRDWSYRPDPPKVRNPQSMSAP